LTLGLLGLLVLWLPAPAAQPGQPTGQPGGKPRVKVVAEHWDAAYLEGSRAGYVRTLVEEIEDKDEKLYRTTMTLKLKVKRFNDVIELAMDTGTTETAGGKVLGTFMRQYLGKNKSLEITGTVAGKEIRLVMDNGKPLKSAPWNDAVLGMYRQLGVLKDKNAKPGDKISYLAFEPSVNLVVTTNVKVKDYEDVGLLGGAKKRLLRVETQPEKIQSVQLPVLISWVDEHFAPLRSETEAPGLGKLVLQRTTKEVALAPADASTLTDIGISQYIRLKRPIAQPYASKSAVYRITLKGDDNPGDAFSRDERQEAKNVKDSSFELHVRASRGPKEGVEDVAAKKEFSESNYFINSADPLVKKHARQAVGAEKDPWKKALRIEKWVREHMRVTSHEALAPADHVAKTLEGDCSEHAMLAAAMCRAEGVPSRTAVGLIYADVKIGPVFAFHMWTEVWVQGQWAPIDATLGRGYVGATHLKIADQSWHDERSLTPLLPVVRVLGRMSIEPVRVE
jgi:hypothetical protein